VAWEEQELQGLWLVPMEVPAGQIHLAQVVEDHWVEQAGKAWPAFLRTNYLASLQIV